LIASNKQRFSRWAHTARRQWTPTTPRGAHRFKVALGLRVIDFRHTTSAIISCSVGRHCATACAQRIVHRYIDYGLAAGGAMPVLR